MSNFYSTLVQVVATSIGILLASITAYFVFLQDRNMQFRDKIEQEKFEIRDLLLELGGLNWPGGLAHYVPPEFAEHYRLKHPNESRQEFLMRATGDLFFQKPELTDLILELHATDCFKGPWRGRVYFWLLNEGLTTITLNTPDAQIAVFPHSREDFGFERWRDDFNKLRGPIQLLSDIRADMIQDFNQFAAQPDFKDRKLEQY